MARIVVTSFADADAAAIQKNLAKSAGIGVATKYTAAFERLYDRRAAHPASGAPRPSSGRDIRIAIVLPYVVIYRYDADADVVTVLRILHGCRNITAKLMKQLGETVIGPVLVGLAKPVQIVQMGSTVNDILTAAAFAALATMVHVR